MAPFSFIPSTEPEELAADVRELFAELAASLRRDQRAFSGECRPSLDVRETDVAVEVTVDVAGMEPESLRILFRAGVLLIAGEKAPTPTSGDQSFHLVEREFGRFARAVRIQGAFDIASATATVEHGELTVLLHKVPERRGRAHRITVTGPRPGAA